MHEPDPFEGHMPARAAPIFFRDRADAGRQLGAMLGSLLAADPVVLGLPRGGVPVAAEVARALRAPLDLILVRKLGVPYQPELAVGAIGEGGVRVLNEVVRRAAAVDDRDLAAVEARERGTLESMARRFRRGRPPLPLDGRTVVIVDDGIATGSTARAACEVAREHGAARVVLAAPVVPAATLDALGEVADDVVCVEAPEQFFAIGQWYDDFAQTSDDEVVALLGGAAAQGKSTDAPLWVHLPSGRSLPGHLAVPGAAIGLVLFAHGSGSSRLSPRNQEVARRLRAAGIGTLLFDLLTPEEEEDRSNVFDVDLLSARLLAATEALRAEEPALPIGYFGASTGAAAALSAAALSAAGGTWAGGSAAGGSRARTSIAAIVARGGRPDLSPRLGDVRSPTLLVVGGRDLEVLELNRRALTAMRCERELVVVEGAGHLFEEPGTLEQVADLAAAWFSVHFLDVGPRS